MDHNVSKQSRRSFIKKTGVGVGVAAFGLPTLVPSSVFGANPPSETVVMGMIGTGRQCYHKNIPLFQRQPDCRIVAVCDADSWRMNEAKKKVDDYNLEKHKIQKGCDTYADYRDLLARDDIDAVMVSTPDHWHGVMGVEAMKAGKDVAMEKPVIRTIREGQKYVEASKQYGRIFRVDSEFRVGQPARRAYSIIQSGALGKIHKTLVCVPKDEEACPAQPDMPVPPELDYKAWQGAGITQAPPIPYTVKGVHPRHGWGRPGWMCKLNYCDGMITNWGAHLLNGALWCLGLDRDWPEEISGTGSYPGADYFWNVLQTFDVHYKYANGVTITYRTESPYVRFEGDKGWIEFGFSHFKASDDAITKKKYELVDTPKPHEASEKCGFLHSVKTREPGLEPAEVGHHVTSTCLLGNLAISLGETLRWDGENERFIDNDKANAWLDKPVVKPNPALQS